jgi:hypothetical protein
MSFAPTEMMMKMWKGARFETLLGLVRFKVLHHPKQVLVNYEFYFVLVLVHALLLKSFLFSTEVTFFHFKT